MKKNCLIEACLAYFGFEENCKERVFLYESFAKIKGERIKEIVAGEHSVEIFLVEKINASIRRKYYYQYIYGRLQECCILIEREEYERVENLYSTMIKILTEEVNDKKLPQ